MLNLYTRWTSALAVAVCAVAISLSLQGCAAPLAVMAGSALESGTSTVIKTGTETTMGGTVRRTFSIPVDDVHKAIVKTFEREDIQIKKDDESPKGRKMLATAEHRKIQVKLTPLTRDLTLMTLAVKKNVISKDKATTSELLEQIEQTLAETPQFAKRMRRESPDYPAASPR